MHFFLFFFNLFYRTLDVHLPCVHEWMNDIIKNLYILVIEESYSLCPSSHRTSLYSLKMGWCTWCGWSGRLFFLFTKKIGKSVERIFHFANVSVTFFPVEDTAENPQITGDMHLMQVVFREENPKNECKTRATRR